MRDWRFWRNLALFGCFVLVVSLAGGISFLARQQALKYTRPQRFIRTADDTPAREGIPYEDIALTTSDDLTLQAWYTPPQNGAVILVAHGHAGARSTDMHTLFARNGYGVLSWDFRAHGESDGEISTLGYYEVLDVEAALNYALSQPEVEYVAAWGGSMGAAAVIMAAAARPEIKALVADSAFAVLEDELIVMIQIEWMRPLIRFFAEQELHGDGSINDVRPENVIGEISPRPVMIIQGLSDGSIPTDSGARLFAAAGEPRVFWVEPGVGHLLMQATFPDEYERRVIGFFDEALLR